MTVIYLSQSPPFCVFAPCSSHVSAVCLSIYDALFNLEPIKGALQLQLTAMVKFALLRYLSEFRPRVSSF